MPLPTAQTELKRRRHMLYFVTSHLPALVVDGIKTWRPLDKLAARVDAFAEKHHVVAVVETIGIQDCSLKFIMESSKAQKEALAENADFFQCERYPDAHLLREELSAAYWPASENLVLAQPRRRRFLIKTFDPDHPNFDPEPLFDKNPHLVALWNSLASSFPALWDEGLYPVPNFQVPMSSGPSSTSSSNSASSSSSSFRTSVTSYSSDVSSDSAEIGKKRRLS
ncbi:hypothetical protein JCM10212_003523 [Sporobolomyces blumeae]